MITIHLTPNTDKLIIVPISVVLSLFLYLTLLFICKLL